MTVVDSDALGSVGGMLDAGGNGGGLAMGGQGGTSAVAGMGGTAPVAGMGGTPADPGGAAGMGGAMGGMGGVAGMVGAMGGMAGSMGGTAGMGGMGGMAGATSPTPLAGATYGCNDFLVPVADVIAEFSQSARTDNRDDRAGGGVAIVRGGSAAGSVSAERATLSPARCTSGFSLRLVAAGNTQWAVFQLPFQSNMHAAYDGSRFKGIQLFARATAPVNVRVKLPDRNTASWGGVCSGSECDDHWGRTIQVGTEWRLYRLMFDTFDGGRNALFGPFLTSTMYGVELRFSETQSDFDLLIDNMAFLR